MGKVGHRSRAAAMSCIRRSGSVRTSRRVVWRTSQLRRPGQVQHVGELAALHTMVQHRFGDPRTSEERSHVVLERAVRDGGAVGPTRQHLAGSGDAVSPAARQLPEPLLHFPVGGEVSAHGVVQHRSQPRRPDVPGDIEDRPSRCGDGDALEHGAVSTREVVALMESRTPDPPWGGPRCDQIQVLPTEAVEAPQSRGAACAGDARGPAARTFAPSS